MPRGVPWLQWVLPPQYTHLLPSLPSRDRRDRHRSKSRDGSRGDKSVTIQAPGEPLLDNESTRGDERVSWAGGGMGLASQPRHGGAAEGGSRQWSMEAPDMPSAPQQSSQAGWAGPGLLAALPSAGGEGRWAARVQMKGDWLSECPVEAAGVGMGYPGWKMPWGSRPWGSAPWRSAPWGLAPAPCLVPTGLCRLSQSINNLGRILCPVPPPATLALHFRGVPWCEQQQGQCCCALCAGCWSPVPIFNHLPATYAGGSSSFHLPPPRSQCQQRLGFAGDRS